MKNLKLGLFVLVAILTLWGCQENNETKTKTKTIISGKVTPAVDAYVTLSIGGIIDSARINKEGDFTLKVDLEDEGTGMLLFDNRFANIYLESGKELILGINAINFPEDLNFAGELGPVNNYLHLAGKLDQNTAITQEELYRLEADRFIQISDSILNLKLQLLKEYVMRYPELDPEFVTQHKTDIQYAWATQRLQYPGYHALLKREIAKLPDNYHNTYLADLELNNSELLSSPVFQGFLEDYLDYRQAIYLQDNPDVEKLWFPGSVARFRVINQEFTDSIVKNYVLFTSMDDHLDNFGTEHLETFLTNFQIFCKNQDYQDLIDLKLENLKKLERGKPAPNFTALDINENKVSLSDYKGSLTYINLWATWSSWSLQEFAYWEDLVRKFSPRGVTFISVSMDFIKDIKNWKYLIDDKKLSGVHLIQDPESSIWQDQYYIKDLPRYLLIDKDGMIISVYAPRPSENMEEVLERLLKE